MQTAFRGGYIYYYSSGWYKVVVYSGGYTYLAQSLTLGGESQSPGELLGVIRSDVDLGYPENGIHTDGYWYIRVR